MKLSLGVAAMIADGLDGEHLSADRATATGYGIACCVTHVRTAPGVDHPLLLRSLRAMSNDVAGRVIAATESYLAGENTIENLKAAYARHGIEVYDDLPPRMLWT